MKTRHFISVATLVALLTACIPSVNPFYEDKDVVSNSQLLGQWEPKKDSQGTDPETWNFEQAGTNVYKVLVDNNSGKHGEFEAHLFMLKHRLFMDVIASKCEFATNQIEEIGFTVFPGHMLFLVPQLETKLKLACLNYEWLQKYLETNPSALPHRVQDDGILLTASTSELQKFILKHLDSGELFPETNEWVRKTNGASPK